MDTFLLACAGASGNEAVLRRVGDLTETLLVIDSAIVLLLSMATLYIAEVFNGMCWTFSWYMVTLLVIWWLNLLVLFAIGSRPETSTQYAELAAVSFVFVIGSSMYFMVYLPLTDPMSVIDGCFCDTMLLYILLVVMGLLMITKGLAVLLEIVCTRHSNQYANLNDTDNYFNIDVELATYLPHALSGEYKCKNSHGNDPMCRECAICLAEFAPRVRIVILPCKHRFHEACFSEWTEQPSRSLVYCPLCRMYVAREL